MLQNEVYVLNPDYHFKSDGDRIAMYSKKQVAPVSSPDWVSFVHPIQAQILNAFSRKKTIDDQCNLLAHTYGLSKEQILELLSSYIENDKIVFTIFCGTKIYFPKNVLIALDKVESAFKENANNVVQVDKLTINLKQDRMHIAPQSILLMLTNKCVTNCKYCYADKNTKYVPMSTDEILHLINDAKRLKMSYIDVIGGEVFCRKDWDIIIKKIVDNGLMPNFISTKMPIDEKTIKKLKSTGYNNVVQISLDSLDEQVLHTLIDCKVGYVSKMKQTIVNLEKYGFKVQFDTILTKLKANRKSLYQLFLFISDVTNVEYWEIRIPEVSIYTPETYKKIKASKGQLLDCIEYINEVLRPKAQFNLFCSDNCLEEHLGEGKDCDKHFYGGNCVMLKQLAFVLPDGKVSACEQLYWHPQFIIGDLKKQSIEEIWNSPKAWELYNLSQGVFRKESVCSHCKIFDFCNLENHRRCFVKVIKAYGKDKWDYPDPRCQYAPKVTSDLLY